MSNKRKASEIHTSSTSPEEIYTSNPINDRASTFIGRYSSKASVKTLQSSADFRDASHRVAAWRKPSAQRALNMGSQPQKQLYDSGHDDDGEKYAGKKLEKLLEDLQLEGSLVVARWYGGVMLGPVRFNHIEDCAREAILRWRESQAHKQDEKRVKLQTDEDATRKAKLEHVLQQRDQSITVLRALLAEKTVANGEASSSAPTTPVKQMDYSKLPLPALVKLETARDKTIGWLLEQISNAEKTATRPAGPSNTHEAEVNADKTAVDADDIAKDVKDALATMASDDFDDD